MSLPLAEELAAVTALGHQGAAMDNNIADPRRGSGEPVCGRSGPGFALLECGCYLSLSWIPRLMIFWKAAQCRDVLWTHGALGASRRRE